LRELIHLEPAEPNTRLRLLWARLFARPGCPGRLPSSLWRSLRYARPGNRGEAPLPQLSASLFRSAMFLWEILCLHASRDKAVAWFCGRPAPGPITELAMAMSSICRVRNRGEAPLPQFWHPRRSGPAMGGSSDAIVGRPAPGPINLLQRPRRRPLSAPCKNPR